MSKKQNSATGAGPKGTEQADNKNLAEIVKQLEATYDSLSSRGPERTNKKLQKLRNLLAKHPQKIRDWVEDIDVSGLSRTITKTVWSEIAPGFHVSFEMKISEAAGMLCFLAKSNDTRHELKGAFAE